MGVFTDWVCGFRGTKDNCPEPWRSMPDSMFSRARRISAPGIISTFSGITVGASTFRAIYAALDGSAYFSTTNAGDVVVEMPKSTTPGATKCVVYYARTHEIKGCIRDEEGNYLPYSTQNTSGDAVALAIILAQAKNVGKSANPNQTLCEMKFSDFKPEASQDYLVHFANIAGYFYFGMVGGKTSSIPSVPKFPLAREDGGIDDKGNLPLLTEVDIADVARTIDTPEATRIWRFRSDPEDIAAPVVFTTKATAKAKEKEKTAAADGALTKDLPIEELQRRLKVETHELNAQEQSMVEVIGENYVVSDELLRLAKVIHDDWHMENVDLAQNIILEGDSGSGKTAATKFLSCVLGLPRTKMTMSPTTESANLIGAFYPVFSDEDSWECSEQDKEAVKLIKENMLFSVPAFDPSKKDDVSSMLKYVVKHIIKSREDQEAFRVVYGIPTIDEIEIDPDGAWSRLGRTRTDAFSSTADIQKAADDAFENAMFGLLDVLSAQANAGAVSYRFILSELMKAFKNGWLLEIQEAASILRPGVLTELNSLLEPNGRIELPNGEYIYRHPDTLVVITTNREYAGNMELNESLRDRCTIGLKMDLPPAEVMAARAMKQTGFADKAMAIDAAEAIIAVRNTAASRNIRGSFGMRSLIAWMVDLKRGDYSEEAFRLRVVYKMTTRDDDVDLLMSTFRSSTTFGKKHPSGARRK